jgi:metallophosphoesterase (TIGR03767 family)
VSRTDKVTIAPAKANNLGWKELVENPGESHINDLPKGKVLTVLGHFSDLHVCDAESPSRIEYLDRYSDPDNPMRDVVGYIGTYRAQEILTTQVLASMVDAMNEIEKGPLTNAKIEAVVVTGDMTDNAQKNEANWYINTLNGGQVNPVSGNREKSEWVGSLNVDYDVCYWHPDGAPNGKELDRPIAKFGFPIIKGLVEKARSEFKSNGLKFPWFATYGNHDQLLQGTVAPDEDLNNLTIGNERIVGLPENFKNPEVIIPAVAEVGPVKYPHTKESPRVKITADQERAFNTPGTFAKAHLDLGGNPNGHGFNQENVNNNTAYWYKDLENVRLISMDTVNPHGGWQGSIDEIQFSWIKSKLGEAKEKYCILLSHHPSPTLINGYAPSSKPRRILKDELLKELYKHKNLIAWIAGHVHRHASGIHTRSDGSTFLELTTASHIDWPQQSRILEFVKEEGQIAIGSTVIDHAGDLNWHDKELNYKAMAGISRSLALNDWQRRDGFNPVLARHGNKEDRNIVWRVSDPFSKE